jgi:beta-barrel assembly-enhancing protease
MTRRQPIRSRWLMPLAGIVTAAMVTALPPMPGARAQLFGMSEQQEIALGRQVEVEVSRNPGFVDDPERTRYVSGIAIRLAKVSERPDLPWTYHIVRDASVNAFAAPGGFIFVNRGLLAFVKSGNELAFVLGHETVHVAHRHAVKLAQRNMEVQFGAILLTQLVFGGSWTAYQLSQIATSLVGAKFSRDDESEADHYGVIYAQKAGFDPTASLIFFERLQRLEKTQPSALAHAFEDHPDTPARIKALRSELESMGYRVGRLVDQPLVAAQGPPQRSAPSSRTPAPIL